MSGAWTWAAVAITVAGVALYEVLLLLLQQRRPGHLARGQLHGHRRRQ